LFFFSSRRRHTSSKRDWSSDVCSSDLGGIDLATDMPPNEWDRVEDKDNVELIEGETTRVNLLMVRTTEGTVTEDPKVREAIDLAIDKQAIVDSLLKGTATPIRTRVPEEVFGANTNLYDTQVHDVEKAK